MAYRAIVFFSALFFIFSFDLNAQMAPSVMDYNLLYSSDVQYHDYKRREKTVDGIQALLIEKMFTSQLFNSDVSIIPEDEDDENYFQNKQQKAMINELLARELAKKLAKEDMIGFRKQFLENIQ